MPSFKNEHKRRGSQEVLLIPNEEKENDANYGAIDEKKSKSKKIEKESKTRALKDLYRYATAADIALIFFGILCSTINGIGFPLMSVLLGGLTNNFIGAEKVISNSNVFSKNVTLSSGTTASVEFTLAPDVIVASNYSGAADSIETFNKNIVDYSSYYAYMGIIILVTAYVQTSCWMISCERQIHKIRKQFFKSIMRQEISWFDEHQSGELTTQLSDNLDRIKEGLGDKLGLLLQYSAQFFAGFVIAFIYSWKLTLVLMALTPLMVVTVAVMSKIVSNATKNEQRKYALAGAVAEEVLSCIRTVMAFNGQKQESERYEKALDNAKKQGNAKWLYTGTGFAFLFIIIFSSYALAFWFGAKLIVWKEINPGTVFIVLMAVMSGSMSLGNTAPQIAVLAAAKGAAAVIFDIIDAKPTIDPYSTSGIKLEQPQGWIEFNSVKFAYPTRKEVVVLKNATFSVEPGQCVALVGSSGCGKSTVVSLLLRYYDVDSGEVSIDGENVKNLNLRWLRNMIAVVSQEPILFDATVEDNIRFGRLNVTKSELIEAAKMANAHDFICTLPEGYRTRVGERGTQLSGGQKQRLAIARALVRRPKILLLDEATSALDAESESLVQEALDKARQGRTTIVIAHRLSTIRNADKIIALKEGQIAETGTHEQLMAQKGLYHDLVTAQTFETTAADAVENEEDDVFGGSGEDSGADVSDQTKALRKITRQLSRSVSRKATVGYLSDGELSGPPGRKISRLLSKPLESEKDRLQREAKEEHVDQSTVMSIVKENKPEWFAILMGFLGSAIRGIVFPAFALFYSQMFAAYSKEGDELIRESSLMSIIFVALGIAMGLGQFLSVYFFGISSENLTMRLRMKAFKNILRQDASYFDESSHSSGKLCTRLASDAPTIKGAVDMRMGTVLTSMVSMVAGVVIGFIYGWKLTLLMLLILPIFALGTYVNIKLRRGAENRDSIMLEDAGQTAAEAIENIRTVQALTREVPVHEIFCHYLERPFKRALRNTQIQAVSYGFSQCIVFFFYAACFRFGGFLVMKGDMKPLDVFKVFFVIMFCGMTIGWATAYFPEMLKARVAAGLIMKMINEQPRIDSASGAGLKNDYKGAVTFQSVYFSYPTRSSAPILRGMGFHVPSGKTIALVGSSGCGKSTVVSLLERFYDPVDGKILIDDTDLRSFNVRFSREQMALVSQEPTLFDCSIAENISYGLSGVSRERITEAASLANIHEFVMGLPDGYSTRVGEKGVQLSGGQKQRVAIARALVRNPKILLLDEATSALDTESEKVVQEALDRARQGRTCIIIAHRLSTIQNADHIVVLRNGRIVEQGTHSELVAKRGPYYELTKKQHLIR